MTQTDLTQIKRLLAQKLLNQMPDEALGELVAEMREIADFYHNDGLIQRESQPTPVEAKPPTHTRKKAAVKPHQQPAKPATHLRSSAGKESHAMAQAG